MVKCKHTAYLHETPSLIDFLFWSSSLSKSLTVDPEPWTIFLNNIYKTNGNHIITHLHCGLCKCLSFFLHIIQQTDDACQRFKMCCSFENVVILINYIVKKKKKNHWQTNVVSNFYHLCYSLNWANYFVFITALNGIKEYYCLYVVVVVGLEGTSDSKLNKDFYIPTDHRPMRWAFICCQSNINRCQNDDDF